MLEKRSFKIKYLILLTGVIILVQVFSGCGPIIVERYHGRRVYRHPDVIVLPRGYAPVVPAVLKGPVVVKLYNTDGSSTNVVLERFGKGFIGPQGEYYPELPKMEQLKVMYGK